MLSFILLSISAHIIAEILFSFYHSHPNFIPLTQSSVLPIFHNMSSSNKLLTWWRDIRPEVPARLYAPHISSLTQSDKTPVTRGLCSWLPPTPDPASSFSLHLPHYELNKFLDFILL